MQDLQRFLGRDSGAARVEAVFAGVALVVAAVMAVFLFVAAPAPEAAPVRNDPVEEAMTQMMGREIRQFTPLQVRSRFQTYLDPTERTDTQLRNAHRTWAGRVGDPRYDRPDLANDMFIMIDHAMRIRGVRPHEGL